MTIMIGARCKDGVVLVSDRRLVRAGGLEEMTPIALKSSTTCSQEIAVFSMPMRKLSVWLKRFRNS